MPAPEYEVDGGDVGYTVELNLACETLGFTCSDGKMPSTAQDVLDLVNYLRDEGWLPSTVPHMLHIDDNTQFEVNAYEC